MVVFSNGIYIYIAGPLFDDHEREYLEKIATLIEGKGHTTFLPHRDAGIIEGEFTLEMRSKVYLDDKVALEASDCVVALLTGRDIDSGTAAEIGFATASNKKVIGINANNVFFPNIVYCLSNDLTEKKVDILHNMHHI